MKEFLLGPGGAVIFLTLVGVAVLVWYIYASKWPERVFARNPTAEELRKQQLMPQAGAAVDTSAAEGSAGRGGTSGGSAPGYYTTVGQDMPMQSASQWAQAQASLNEAGNPSVMFAPSGSGNTGQPGADRDGDGIPDDFDRD